MGAWVSAVISGLFAVCVAIIEAKAAKERRNEKAEREAAKEAAKRAEAMENGVLALLRNCIISRYNHYMEHGYIPIYGLENVENMYLAYHDLGGNGTVTKLVEELKKLPTEKDDERKEE